MAVDTQLVTTYKGLTVYITKIGSDLDNYDYRATIVGNKYDTANSVMLSKNMEDSHLLSQGYDGILNVNGGLFFSYGGTYYGVGIEKVCGDVHENDDSQYDGCMAIGIPYDVNATPVFDTQANIKSCLNNYYGAVTGAFGIMKDGQRITGGYGVGCVQYYYISGRTIIGWNSNTRQYIIISFAGVTGKSGLYGSQLYDLCKNYCTDAVCMDGGGSVYLAYNHSIKISTSRRVKNDFMIYRKAKQKTTTKTENPVTTVSEEDSDLTKIHVDKVGMYIRDAVKGKIIGYVAPGSSYRFDRVLPVKNRQSDGYQWWYVEGAWEYKGTWYNQGYCQYDSSCYWVE